MHLQSARKYDIICNVMRVYLDNCCYNRPFDDQRDLRVALETFAKLQIQALMKSGAIDYVWSDSLCYEVKRSPYTKRFQSIVAWLDGATEYVETSDEIIGRAGDLMALGVKKMDALHLASAEKAGCDWFFTTDKGILKKVRKIGDMRVANPIEFVIGRNNDE